MKTNLFDYKGKEVHLVFNRKVYEKGGIVSSDYKIIDFVEGNLKMQDLFNHKTILCKPSSISRISVLRKNYKSQLLMEVKV